VGERKHKLVDCNPRFAKMGDRGDTRYLTFDCPEGHSGCNHCIPFSPSMEGNAQTSPQTNGAQWDRAGDTFETLTLSPSIRSIPRYPDRAAAIAAGCDEEYLDESYYCALHIFIKDGVIEFCGDSK
jgi:hypothetical protein